MTDQTDYSNYFFVEYKDQNEFNEPSYLENQFQESQPQPFGYNANQVLQAFNGYSNSEFAQNNNFGNLADSSEGNWSSENSLNGSNIPHNNFVQGAQADYNSGYPHQSSYGYTGTENHGSERCGLDIEEDSSIENSLRLNNRTTSDNEPKWQNALGQPASAYSTHIGNDSKFLNLANQGSDKMTSNANGVKNYITITSKTFAKFVLEQPNHEIAEIIDRCIENRNPVDFFKAKKAVMDYISDKISGKKIHRNGSKQYKITARKDIEAVFFGQTKDSDEILTIKAILKDMMASFLRSSTFQDWIITEYEAKSSGGKDFYLDPRNLAQFVGVYTDSEFKPRFN